MSDVENFIYSNDGHQKDVMLFLHNYMVSQPAISAKIRFHIPFYYRKTWICYMNPRKDNSIEFCFIRGRELSDGQGILEYKGRVMVTSVNIKTVKDIPEQALFEVIQEAILLDENVPFTVKKKKK
ncbi:MAG: DUF1801 domain-containing protein [Bacteroidia bacterium]|nr:DUF1801 domain-containing protein [Bacteroidia bacterium]